MTGAEPDTWPASGRLLNPGNDQLFSLILDSLKLLDDKKADRLAEIAEHVALVAELSLYELQMARRVIGRSAMYLPIIENFALLSKLFRIITQDLAIVAIRNGALTRRQIAEVMSVHENTVARWVGDAVKRDEANSIKMSKSYHRDWGDLMMTQALGTLYEHFPQYQTIVEASIANKTPVVDELLRRTVER